MAQALYVHIPFCDAICAYCDFARVLNKPEVVEEYLDVLEAEMKLKDLTNLKTVYIGGGTPSALTPSQLTRLFTMLDPYTKNLEEYTIEINPESLTREKGLVMKSFGVNRASLGMQVTQNKLLKVIDRKHTIEEVYEAVEVLHSVGIDNISIDLMYGIPTQTIEDLHESLQVLMDFNINHISLYGLTIEPNSKFGRLGYKPAPSDLDASMYELAVDFLAKHGFNRYEISNFAKEGYQSIHNKVYWNYDDFIGLGLHASGKEKHVRYTNNRNLRQYLNGKFEGEIIELTKEDEMFEYLMMNLRLSEGMSISKYNQSFDVDFKEKYQEVIKELQGEGLLLLEDDNVRASAKGLELLFDVLEKFMEE